MKITKLRIKGKHATGRQIHELNTELRGLFSVAGFITDVDLNIGRIGLHMRSFRIDTMKIGHNARVDRWQNTLVGWKRTDVPTWDQRVEFNNIINNTFDKHHVTAKVMSGHYLIRDANRGALTERDWLSVNGEFFRNDHESIRPLTQSMIDEAKVIRREAARKRTKAAKNETPVKSHLALA